MKPTRSLIICTTARSGSGHLCDALWNTGLAGQPDEYFGAGTRKRLTTRWETGDEAAYLEAMFRRTTTGNGVFSAKIHWEHIGDFVEIGRSIPQNAGLGIGAMMEALFPAARYVWLSRRDEVRQAVSLYRADYSGIYGRRESDLDVSASNEPALPPFDYEEISRRISRARAATTRWNRHFREQGIEPLRLVYEDDLRDSYESTVRRVLDFAAINIPKDLRIVSKRLKQSDEKSEDLVHRYIELERKPWKRIFSAITRRFR